MEDKFIMSKTADRETFVVSLIVWRQKENKCSSKNENIKTQKLSELLSLHWLVHSHRHLDEDTTPQRYNEKETKGKLETE